MTGRILVPAEDVWDYLVEQKRLYDLDSPEFAGFDIACNDDAGIEVTLDFDTDEIPYVTVTDDFGTLYEEELTKEECEAIVQAVYDNYISDRVFSLGHDSDDPCTRTDPPPEEDEAEEEEDDTPDEADERENDLFLAVEDMLSVVLEDEEDEFDTEGMAEDVLDHLCEWLWEEYGVSVRRPMRLVNDDGREIFTDHPYDYLLKQA